MEVVEDFESRPHEAVSFVVRTEKEIKEWNEQKLPKVLPGRLAGRNTTEKGRAEGEVDEDSEERRIRSQIVQEVVASIKEKVSVHSGEKDDVKRPVEQSFMLSWDCSQLERRKGTKWQPSGRKSKNWMRLWNKEGLKEDSLKLEVMRKAPELVVHERMSQGEGVRGPKEFQDGLPKK